MKLVYKHIAVLCITGLPIILFTIIGYSLYSDFKQYLKEVVALVLLHNALFSLVFLINCKAYRIFNFWLASFILSLFVSIKLTFMNYYGARINASAVFIIIQTNTGETIDFLSTYFTRENISLIILSFLQFPILYFYANWKEALYLFRKPYTKIIFIAVFCFYLYQTNLRFFNEDLFFRFTNSIKGYQLYQKGLKNSLTEKVTQNIQTITTDSISGTHIVLIGESTTKQHMELYGYYRKTNPLLSVQNNLFVFDDVISPHTHTLTSLEKILTLNSFENENIISNFSIVQMANAANYKTYWLSVQEPMGLTETLPTIVSHAADEVYFLETNNWQERVYDEKILPRLEKVLGDKEGRKVIFIHLMGTHVAYEKRYPSKFSYFDGEIPKTVFNENEAFERINFYDNAVRYNDFIISSIISILDKTDTYSSVSYFSDHGQEVYNSQYYMGHDEMNPTKSMYEIPFMFWFSEKFIDKNTYIKDISNYSERRYILEDFPYTLADLLHIDFKRNDRTKSLISPFYEEKVRKIKNDQDYDKIELP